MHRDFKGVWIPKEIYLDDNLNWTEKILLIEIDSLDNEEGCYASNKYFAGFLGKSKRHIRRSLKTLKDNGYIKEKSFDGRKRILKSNLKYVLADRTRMSGEGGQKCPGGQPPQSQANHDSNQQKNDSINITNNIQTEEEETEGIDLNIPAKIKQKFQQIFNQQLSVELYQKIAEMYSNTDIIMKALSVCEKQADKPIYLLKILKDWRNNELESVSSINTYIENRQANKELRHSKKETTATRPETPEEELQRLYEKGYR